MEKMVYDLQIDPELRDYIPPLQDSEKALLAESLRKEGCRDPIIIWNGVIVDGHNRYTICHENNIPFAVEERSFKNIEQAKLWMAKNQLGHRNLNAYQRCKLVIPLENTLKEEAETLRREKIAEYRKTGETVQNSAPSKKTKTRDLMAALAGISHDTIQKVKRIDLEADQETLDKLQRGDTSINYAYNHLKSEKSDVSKKEGEARQVASEEVPAPTSFIDHPTEDPVTHTEPERIPRPYQFVKEQLEFAIDNMIADMKVGVYSLRNEDFDKKTELKNIMKGGYERAVHIIDGLEKLG